MTSLFKLDGIPSFYLYERCNEKQGCYPSFVYEFSVLAVSRYLESEQGKGGAIFYGAFEMWIQV